ncbi:srg family chemoreceptor domain-containing protein [Ditylenchus destructor]|uniref:Serpentine receptor class gamma n=1 Tax=Ditylenchus destructor TaxID=166010 RepID=A0AAD4QYI9_9BILA|nr:srg family chemoreceptor domain-containing protein [Ditylenchus destructor]
MPPQFLAVFFFFNYYTFHADNLSTMFILLNRLTLILVPIGQEKIWKYLLPVSILATHLAPLAWTVQVLTYEFHVRLQNDNVTFTLYIQPNPNRTYIASAYVAAVSALLFGVICGVLNIVTVVLFRRTRGTQANVDKASSVEQKVESRLTIYALVTFLSQLSMAVYYVLTYIASWLFQSDFNFFLSIANQFCWVHDLSNIVLPAWCLLWASSEVKEHVYSMLIPRSKKKNDKIFIERRTPSSMKNVNT